jgi:hypothetical protein
MVSPWKVICGSVAGSSHERCGEPCQDYSHTCTIDRSSGLVLACSDGAGTARYADRGAKIACLGFIHAARAALDDGLQPSDITAHDVLKWHDEIRRRLSLEACLVGAELSDFACTLLAAIADDCGGLFCQIGDGAIVTRQGADYETVIWPQTGEYVNTTFFLTGKDFQDHLVTRRLEEGIHEIALFTDGLQPLALHYASRSVHAAFFEPMFATLRATSNPEQLESPLRDFLKSRPVVDRTDDDKTLILATREVVRNGLT